MGFSPDNLLPSTFETNVHTHYHPLPFVILPNRLPIHSLFRICDVSRARWIFLTYVLDDSNVIQNDSRPPGKSYFQSQGDVHFSNQQNFQRANVSTLLEQFFRLCNPSYVNFPYLPVGCNH